MLTKEIAEQIVKQTMERLNRNVNIMDASGVIIASGDKSRINTIHEGALEVIKTKAPFIITDEQTHLLGVKPGINLPINFHDDIVGVIGITGDAEEIEDFGSLVKMITEMMINQAYLSSQVEWKYRTQEIIMDNLLKKDFQIEYLTNRLKLLDIEFLNGPYLVVIIQIKERTIADHLLFQILKRYFPAKTSLMGFIKVNRLVLMTSQVNELSVKKLKQLYSELKHQSVQCVIAYSRKINTIEEISSAYQESDLALMLNTQNIELISIEDIEAQALIYQLDKDLKERYVERFSDVLSDKMIETLEVYFKANQNINETANQLYLHRNTLLYRLKQIKEMTGYDPKVFKDAVALQIFVWLKTNQNTKSS